MDNTGAESKDTYLPFLADMLKLEQNANISLSDIGRRVYGSSPEYTARRQAVDQARQAMEGALAERKFRFDPKMLALAQGFLAPTQTGSFGESLGMAAGQYAQAQQAEDARLRELARMRYELARSGLQEEKELASLGLSVASKITPALTNIQKQILSEGINPRSPQGQARAQELYALTQATPDMKEFAARAGIPLTDPNFSARFTQSRGLEPLRPIASRLGLDLNRPEDVEKARLQLQAETLRSQKPDVAKMLDKFGGDPMNPQDVARAEKMLTEERALEISAKQLNMQSVRTNIQRTQQEIAENTRQGNYNVLPQRAAEMGVPVDPLTKYQGMTVKQASEARAKDMDEAERLINDKIIPNVQSADTDINNLKRARDINSRISTGVTYGLPLGIGATFKTLSGDKALIDEFDSLAALAAKANRIPGDSNVSNADLAFMRLGTFSTEKQPKTNETIINYLLAQRERDKDYATFMSNYAAVNGVLGPNAQSKWREYLEANPITTRDPVTGAIALNPNRVDFRTYFTAPRVNVDRQGRERGF